MSLQRPLYSPTLSPCHLRCTPNSQVYIPIPPGIPRLSRIVNQPINPCELYTILYYTPCNTVRSACGNQSTFRTLSHLEMSSIYSRGSPYRPWHLPCSSHLPTLTPERLLHILELRIKPLATLLESFDTKLSIRVIMRSKSLYPLSIVSILFTLLEDFRLHATMFQIPLWNSATLLLE